MRRAYLEPALKCPIVRVVLGVREEQGHLPHIPWALSCGASAAWLDMLLARCVL